MIPEPGYYWVKFKDGRVTIAKVSEYYFEIIASDEIFEFTYYDKEVTEWFKIISPTNLDTTKGENNE